jgi:hypothetical protein
MKDRNNKHTWLLFAIANFILILASCTSPVQKTYILANKDIRTAAIKYANEYISLGAVYEWGGQDPLPKTIFVDCSGLAIRCYQYACSDYGYKLLFNDTTAKNMQNFAESISPEEGDLIFMGSNGEVTHVALYEKEENGNVYFIDATDLSGIVSERYYPKDSMKFICYKRMYVEKE